MFSAIDWPALLTNVGFASLGGLGMYFAIAGVFELLYYRRRAAAAEWKCQPRRWPSPKARKDEIVLGAANMAGASIASGIFVYYVQHGGYTTLYYDLSKHGLAYSIASGVAYLLGTDLALYWAHRLYHTPTLYKRIHKVHHRWTSPTAFTSMAMHPIELATYQSIMLVPLFFVPLSVYAVVAVLVATNYYALVDHSGVRARSWLPFIAPAQFHDDHHAHFHVNYGQSFFLWDRVFGTMRRKGRKYGVEVFGGKGAGEAAAPVEYWDYTQEEVAAAPAPAVDLGMLAPGAESFPWHVLTSPAAKWAVQPSFVIGEYAFIGLALLALWHAWNQGDERRKHVLVWVAAILAGTANDLIFMTLPMVENFWQAQATLMITPRLPLYIPCVYVTFMYLPTVSVWRLGLPPISRATLSGLAGIAFYAPYDIVGAKFLWWTWHDTDAPIANRLLGVPIGSTVWVIIFVGIFAFLVGRVTDRDPAVSPKTFAKGVAIVMAFCTLLMMVQMAPLQQLDGGVPGVRGLIALVVVYAGIALWGFRRAKPLAPRKTDRILLSGIVALLGTLVLVLALFDPATHRSESLHQQYGACDVEATDIAGHKRKKFICAESFDEDFTFACAGALPAEGSRWYTVCGKPHQSFSRWMGGVAGLGVVASLLYAFMLAGVGRRVGAGGDSQEDGKTGRGRAAVSLWGAELPEN